MGDIYSTSDNKYVIVQEATFGTQPAVTGGYELLPRSREIDFDIGMTDQTTRRARGVPYLVNQGSSYINDKQKLNQLPVTSFEMDHSVNNTALLLASFFQRFSAAANVYTYQVYNTDAHKSIAIGDTTDFYAFSLLKQNTTTISVGESMSGCIVRQVTINMSANNPITMAFDVMGCTYDTSVDLTGQGYSSFNADPLLFSDIGAYALLDGAACDLISCNITLNNNAATKPFSYQNPRKMLLGDFDGKVDIVIPWTANTLKDDLKANTDHYIEVYHGSKTGASAGDFYLIACFNLNNAKVTDNEGMKCLTISGADIVSNSGVSGITDPIKIVMACSMSLVTTT